MPKTSFDLLAASPKISVVWSERRFSSVVEQLIRNERVNGSNPLSGSPLFQEDYLLKLTYLGLLAKVTKGNVWTLKVAFRCPKNGYRSRCGFSLAGENHGKVQCFGPAL
jgi:hypothetical protein